MNKLIDSYLNNLFEHKESLFPVDSPQLDKEIVRAIYPKGKKKIVRTIQPEQTDPTSQEKNRIMVDFDGVIHSYDKGWQGGKIYGTPIPGAKETIDQLKETYEIIIFTTRASKQHNIKPAAGEQVEAVRSWLNKHDIYFDRITAEKLGAIAYIDDRAIGFRGSWDDVLKQLRELESKNH